MDEEMSKLDRTKKDKPKYDAYRKRVGKPLGPGVPGNKAGKNHVVKGER